MYSAGRNPASRADSRRGGVKRGLTIHARERLRLREGRGWAGGFLLVALRERIGLDQIGGLVDQFELTIELGLSDSGLRPQVMVFVDADVTFRRTLEFDPRRGRRDLVDVEASGLLDR